MNNGKYPQDLGLTRWGQVENGNPFQKMIQEAWEMGTRELSFIHGYGRSGGFVDTNTGWLGLCVRACLRKDESLGQWIKRSTLNCKDCGVTTITLKPNPNPRPIHVKETKELET
jgi:hypothetical protein